MRARVARGCGTAAGVAGALALAGLALAACGSGGSGGAGGAGDPSGAGGPSATVAGATGATSSAGAVHGRFPVAVRGRFPATQHLAQRTTLRLSITNTGRRALPDVAVTICNVSCAPSARRNRGTAAQPFGHDISGAPNLANPSRPLWIVNRGPGGCHFHCNAPGGSGVGGVTAYANTWALGRLAPGRTARFVWLLTPVVAGRHVVAWEVAGNLTGRARAVARRGGTPGGTFAVTVASAPPRTRVTGSGQVVTVGR